MNGDVHSNLNHHHHNHTRLHQSQSFSKISTRKLMNGANLSNGPLPAPTTLRLGHDKLTDDVLSGQQALDQLLASLAIESNVNDQHLANIENNNYAIVTKPSLRQINGLNQINGNNHDLELSAIIADLTEFGSQHSSGSDSNSNWAKTNGDLNGYSGSTTSEKSEPINQTIKKIVTESESSSSISPSLSERSNAVSWSDQVREKEREACDIIVGSLTTITTILLFISLSQS